MIVYRSPQQNVQHNPKSHSQTIVSQCLQQLLQHCQVLPHFINICFWISIKIWSGPFDSFDESEKRLWLTIPVLLGHNYKLAVFMVQTLQAVNTLRLDHVRLEFCQHIRLCSNGMC